MRVDIPFKVGSIGRCWHIRYKIVFIFDPAVREVIANNCEELG